MFLYSKKKEDLYHITNIYIYICEKRKRHPITFIRQRRKMSVGREEEKKEKVQIRFFLSLFEGTFSVEDAR